FIEEDPGRQIMSGSFNPIDDGEWSVQVYVGETEQFFAAIAAQDRQVIVDMIKDDFDVNRRGHVGHVGRTALHLAIIYTTMIGPLRIMLDGEGKDAGDGDEKNVNDEDGQDLEEDEDDKDGDEDDEDETEGSGSKDAKKPDAGQAQEFPEDAPDQPDILEVNLPDWDLGFTPLAHAVLTGSLDSIEELLDHGADATLVDVSQDTAIHPLSLVILQTSHVIPQKQLQYLTQYSGKVFDGVFFPLETAISKYDDVAQLLLSLDVEFNTKIVNSRGDNIDATRRKTLLDWVH
ncbi:hypothetical protein H0H87_002809, partial [Tephrocybe sp. NHM501043]